jgi:hypothetical protein
MISRTGCVVLLLAATAHCFAYLKFSAPAVQASNLTMALQSVFEIAFLSMAWSWIVLALIVLVVTFRKTRLSKPIGLICGFAVLIQAVSTVPVVGFFLGNEMIGAASLLILIGFVLFPGSTLETHNREPPLTESKAKLGPIGTLTVDVITRSASRRLWPENVPHFFRNSK